jgi:arylsulfatase A-like enzyme
VNIVYLHCHDAGRWLSPYGCPVRTPHLAAFARTALRFDNAHCAAPTCSPSRVAMLTGLSPHEAGMVGLAHRGFTMTRPERHLAVRLRAHGYETALAGIQHEWAFQAPLPYEHVLPREGPGGVNDPENDLHVARQAADFLRRRHRDRPLFLSCGFYFPHRVFPQVESARLPLSGELPAGLPDAPEVRRDFEGYATAVSRMDDAFGAVLEAVEECSSAEETVVLFTTDHGPAFPGMKCRLGAAGTGVALLLRTPDLARSEIATADLISQLDLYPTLGDYAGLPAAEGEGRSLRPLLRAEPWVPAPEIFAEVSYHAAYEPMRSVRTAGHLYLKRFDLTHHPAWANVDDGPTKAWLVARGESAQSVPEEELYDLRSDPGETHNVAAEPAQTAVMNDLRKRLAAWMERTGDPLRVGTVPRPAGARVTVPG